MKAKLTALFIAQKTRVQNVNEQFKWDLAISTPLLHYTVSKTKSYRSQFNEFILKWNQVFDDPVLVSKCMDSYFGPSGQGSVISVSRLNLDIFSTWFVVACNLYYFNFGNGNAAATRFRGQIIIWVVFLRITFIR